MTYFVLIINEVITLFEVRPMTNKIFFSINNLHPPLHESVELSDAAVAYGKSGAIFKISKLFAKNDIFKKQIRFTFCVLLQFGHRRTYLRPIK